jgi:hypothetical protein
MGLVRRILARLSDLQQHYLVVIMYPRQAIETCDSIRRIVYASAVGFVAVFLIFAAFWR